MFNQSDRRGVLLGPGTTLFVTSVVVAALLIAFYLWIIIIGRPAVPTDDKSVLRESVLLSVKAYLATPVNVSFEGKTQTLTLGELIQLAKLNSSYKDILARETKSIFDAVYSDKWGIDISGVYSMHGFKSEAISSTEVATSLPDYRINERIFLPNNITLTLYLV